MAKFLFIYRYPTGVYESTSPDKMQQVMQRWLTWITSAKSAGWMIDQGNELDQDGLMVLTDGKRLNGPFAEAGEIIGGYSMVQAHSLNAAAEFAKDCPGLFAGGRVEVRPLFDGEY
jgi:hypothetical protein